MNRPRSYSSGFLADGGDRLLSGIRAEAQAKLARLSELNMSAEEKATARREVERETKKLIAKLDSPSNFYKANFSF